MSWLMRGQTLEALVVFVLVGWVVVAWFLGNRVGDNVGSISVGVVLFLMVVRGIWRLKASRQGGADDAG